MSHLCFKRLEKSKQYVIKDIIVHYSNQQAAKAVLSWLQKISDGVAWQKGKLTTTTAYEII